MKIYIIGAGCGNLDFISESAKRIIESCGTVIGAERLIEPWSGEKYTEYKPDKIREIIDKSHTDTAVIMSGDTGFYSGTKRLLEALKGYEVEVISGTSSVSYFASKLRIPWENWKLVSMHGLKRNIIGAIKENRFTFALLSNGDDINALCEKLILYSMTDVKLYVGENLSYKNELISEGSPEEFKEKQFSKLAVCLIENKNAKQFEGRIKDENFIRGKVPMTKEAVRTVSLSKLGLNNLSVFYDIGAGTGSIAITAAVAFPDAEVYAFERNPEAVELIEKNKILHKADNIEIVKGDATEHLTDFPIPTHAFIGGSGGKLNYIVKTLKKLNTDIKIVVNTITIESLVEVQNTLKELGLYAEIIQMSVSEGEKVGKYTMMKSQNSVYIISF